MKIFRQDMVFVQINDLMWLSVMGVDMPMEVRSCLFEISYKVFSGKINRYEFVRYVDKESIEFFKNIDWIVDYDLVKDLSFRELICMGKSIKDECNGILRHYNKMMRGDNFKYCYLKKEAEFLNLKWFSVRDFIWFRCGILGFDLPRGIRYPNEISRVRGKCRLLSFKEKS